MFWTSAKSYNFWKSYNTITLLTAKFPYRNISHYVITEIVIYLQVLPYAFDLYVQSWEWVTITTVRCYQHGKIKIYTYTCMYIYIFQKNILKASRRASIDNILSSESTRLQKLFFKISWYWFGKGRSSYGRCLNASWKFPFKVKVTLSKINILKDTYFKSK